MLKAAAAARDIDVGDGTLYVAVAGDRREIAMAHGWTLDHRSWAPDRRGFGRSNASADLISEWQDVDHLVERDDCAGLAALADFITPVLH